jgi:hypothetical protein
MSFKLQTGHSTETDDGADDTGSIGPSFFGSNAPGTAVGAVASVAQAAESLTLADFSAVSAAPPSTAVATTKTTTTAAVTTSTSTSTTSIPSWIKSLATASIETDMAAADVNGTVSYTGLLKVFNDLDTKLGTTKLTAAEMADLKTIAANLNNGLSTSSYLTSITQALVNGNAANASWTGGGAAATALGNLATGSSATQLSELIGKWFMGTDLPSSKVSMDGTNFSVSYSASSKPLFSSSGPSMNDINQGYLGDCYLLSSLAEVAGQNSSDITSMFTSNGNNTYGVRFYVGGKAEYVTVNTSLANGGNIFNYSSSDVWASLAEKAYAQLQASGAVTGNSISGNTWTAIGNGGAPEMALEEITGASAITDFDASGSAWSKVVYNQSFGVTGDTTGNSTSSVLSTLAADLSAGDDLVLSSYTNAKDSSGKTTLVADHAMSVYGYDSKTGMLEIRNPWGTEVGQTWDTTFEVSLSTLLSDKDTITVDNVGQTKTTSTSSGSVGASVGASTISLSAAASGFVQAIASLSSGNLANASLSQTSTSNQSTLASPLA